MPSTLVPLGVQTQSAFAALFVGGRLVLSSLPPLVPRPPNLTLSVLEVSAKMQTRSVVRFPVQPCACARTVLNPFYRGANGGLGVVTRPRVHHCNRQTLSLAPFTMPGADSVPDYRAREAPSLPSNRSQPCVTVSCVWSPESRRQGLAGMGARSRPAQLPDSRQAGRGGREGSFDMHTEVRQDCRVRGDSGEQRGLRLV